MAHVLLFAADVVPLNPIPASGGGVRALQLYRSLQQAGHRVSISAPTHTFIGRQFDHLVDPEIKRLSYTHRTQKSIYQELKPDVVIFASNWLTVAGLWWPDCPVIVDMCGPVLIEAGLASNMDAPAILALFRKKAYVLSKADLLLCGGQRQQWYFRQMMVMAGINVLEPAPIAKVPLGVDPDWIQPKDFPEEPHFVYAGGLYPWQNPSLAIETILEVITDRQRGQFYWYGGSHQVTKLDKTRSKNLLSLLDCSQRGHVHGYLNYQDISTELRRMSISVELMERNIERELAMTTRTPFNLGLGLPVLYGDYADLSDVIQSNNAGWVMANDKDSIKTWVHAILDQPEQVLAKSQSAQELAKQQFVWDKLAGPLLNFVDSPKFRGNKRESLLELESTFLTKGERWVVEWLRSPWLKPLRAMIAPFFRKAKHSARQEQTEDTKE